MSMKPIFSTKILPTKAVTNKILTALVKLTKDGKYGIIGSKIFEKSIMEVTTWKFLKQYLEQLREYF